MFINMSVHERIRSILCLSFHEEICALENMNTAKLCLLMAVDFKSIPTFVRLFGKWR